MEINIIINLIFYTALIALSLSSLGLIIVLMVFFLKRKNFKRRAAYILDKPISHKNTQCRNHKETTTLANGHKKQDYYEQGYTDTDIELWGLDQPCAPDPYIAGFVIADMADGKLDGNFDIFS